MVTLRAFLGIFLALSFFADSAWSQDWTWMYQCESCDTSTKAQTFAASKQRTGSNVYVFSLRHARIDKFQVYYDREFAVWIADPLPVDAAMEDAYSDVLAVEAARPGFFSVNMAVREIEIPFEIVAPNTNPVEISVEGSHSAPFSQFMNGLHGFLNCTGCMRQVSPELADLISAITKLSNIGISGLIGGQIGGVAITWEGGRAVSVKLKICDSRRDCAVVTISADGSITYEGSWADSGNGPKYPGYTSQIDVRFDFDNSLDALTFAQGLRRGGINIATDLMSISNRMLCGYVNGVLDGCRWVDTM